MDLSELDLIVQGLFGGLSFGLSSFEDVLAFVVPVVVVLNLPIDLSVLGQSDMLGNVVGDIILGLQQLLVDLLVSEVDGRQQFWSRHLGQEELLTLLLG